MAIDDQQFLCNQKFVTNDLCLERHDKIDNLESKILRIEDRHMELIRAINGKFTKIWIGIVSIMASTITVLLTMLFK